MDLRDFEAPPACPVVVGRRYPWEEFGHGRLVFGATDQTLDRCSSCLRIALRHVQAKIGHQQFLTRDKTAVARLDDIEGRERALFRGGWMLLCGGTPVRASREAGGAGIRLANRQDSRAIARQSIDHLQRVRHGEQRRRAEGLLAVRAPYRTVIH